PKRPLRITVQRDGEQPTRHELSSSAFETNARRQMRFDMDDVAEIAFSGGAQDARQAMERLEHRWLVEAEPVLKAAQAASLEEIAKIVTETAKRAKEIEAAGREAGQLDQRITDQPDWEALLSERQQQFAAAEKALGHADRSRLEKAARKLRIANVADAE